MSLINPSFQVLTGADPTGLTDSTAAIQAAINACKNSGAPSYGTQTPANGLFIPPGNYIVSALDCTLLSSLKIWAFPGTVIIHSKLQTATLPVFDFTGSSACEVDGLVVYGISGETGNQPSAAFLFADLAGGAGSANRNIVRNCGTVGAFCGAPYYNLGSPNSHIFNCAFQQANVARPVIYIGSHNEYNMQSFANIAQEVGSVGEITIDQTEIHGPNNSQTMSVYLKNASSVRFRGGLIDTNGAPMHAYLAGTCYSVIWDGLEFFASSGHPPSDMIYADGASRNMVFIGINPSNGAYSRYAVFGTAPGTDYTGGRVIGFPGFNGPYAGQFS